MLEMCIRDSCDSDDLGVQILCLEVLLFFDDVTHGVQEAIMLEVLFIEICRVLVGQERIDVYKRQAARRQQILTGIVSSGIIQTENGLPVCPVDFEGLRILIPIREVVLTLSLIHISPQYH